MVIFKKIVITFIVFFFSFFQANSYSEIIKKVEVKGNERISLETIVDFWRYYYRKDYMKVQILSLLIKKLYKTKFFFQIYLLKLNNKLLIIIVRRKSNY